MSGTDLVEYEHYLDMVHKQLDYASFEAEWLEGFSMTIEQVVEDLRQWSGYSEKSPETA